jgi:hypothetical protein
MRADLGSNSKGSFAPLGLDHLLLCTHGLRRGLYSAAAPRLEYVGLMAPSPVIRFAGQRNT